MTLLLALVLSALPSLPPLQDPETGPELQLSTQDLAAAARVLGLEFTEAEREQMLTTVVGHLAELESVRAHPLRWDTPMALGFSPFLPGMEARAVELEASRIDLPVAERPADLDDLAYADIATLASLVRSRAVSCVELCELFLGRLERFDEELNCVVSLLPERALAQARALDA